MTTASQRIRARRTIASALILAGFVGAFGHARLIHEETSIRAAIEQYRRLGDRRENLIRRAALPQTILDCTTEMQHAIAKPRIAWQRESGTPAVETARASWPDEPLLGVGQHPAHFALTQMVASPRSAISGPGAGTAPIRLTLCREATVYAHGLLQQTGRRSVAVAIHPATGRVLVWTEFNPVADAQYRLLALDARAPGSLAKLWVAAAWWGADLPEVNLPCPKRLLLSGRPLRNAHEGAYAVGTTSSMLERSCNTAAAILLDRVVARVGIDSVLRTYARLGLSPHPQPSRARSAIAEASFWAAGNAAASRWLEPPPMTLDLTPRTNDWRRGQLSIGQGATSAPPIRLASFMAAIANGGFSMPLTLQWSAVDSARGRRIVSPAVVHQLREALLDVVLSGTASAYRNGAVTGLEGAMLAGKTSTPIRIVRPYAATDGAPGRRVPVEDGAFAGFVWLLHERRSPLAILVWLDGGPRGAPLATQIADSVAAFILKKYPTLVGAGPATSSTSVRPAQ